MTDDELLALSWSLNDSRRHLTTSQRACAAAAACERLGIKHGGDRKSKTAKSSRGSTTCSIERQFGVGEQVLLFARDLLAERRDLFDQVKRGELTVGAAHEAFRKTKELERAEVERNSLAEMKSKHPDLAEQVENGQITVDEAKAKLEEQAAAKRERTTNLSRVKWACTFRAKIPTFQPAVICVAAVPFVTG